MASRINVDTVIEWVGDDVRVAITRLTKDTPQATVPTEAFWLDAVPVTDPRHGYLQHIDPEGLASWAAEHKTSICLLVRPGDYVFPGSAIALARPFVGGISAAIHDATALGPTRTSTADLEFAIRQLVEVAVRALSPGINDPHTAIGVIDRLGSALCDLVPSHLPTGVISHHGRVALVVPNVDYDGLVDTMFHMIRQNAGRSVAVLICLIEVLTANGTLPACERFFATQTLSGRMLKSACPREVNLTDVRRRYKRFQRCMARADHRWREKPRLCDRCPDRDVNPWTVGVAEGNHALKCIGLSADANRRLR